MSHSVRTQYYCEADWPGSRATALFSLTVPLSYNFVPLLVIKRLEEKAGEEQMSEKRFTWAD